MKTPRASSTRNVRYVFRPIRNYLLFYYPWSENIINVQRIYKILHNRFANLVKHVPEVMFKLFHNFNIKCACNKFLYIHLIIFDKNTKFSSVNCLKCVCYIIFNFFFQMIKYRIVSYQLYFKM